MNALLLLYALTLTLELLLSLLMAIFLYLIIAPRSGRTRTRATPPAPAVTAAPPVVPTGGVVADPTVLAVRRALDTIARGENDVQTLIRTRRVLQTAERDLRERARRQG